MVNNTTSPAHVYPAELERIVQGMSEFGKKQPQTMAGFASLHKAACQPGALDAKTKELIALAIAVASRCDNCIAFHAHDALKSGASREEIDEALGVAVLMGGGPALMYALHVRDAVDQFEAA